MTGSFSFFFCNADLYSCCILAQLQKKKKEFFFFIYMHVECVCVCVCVVIQSCWYDSQGDTCSVVHAAKRHNNVRLFWAVLLCTVPFFFLSVMCVAPFIHFPSSCSSSLRITGGSNYYFLFVVVAVAVVCTKMRSRRAALRNIATLSEKALCSVASFFFFSFSP